MRRKIKKGISLVLSMGLVVISFGFSSVAQTETYFITEAYEYPMTQDSVEWQSLETPEERKEAFSVPDEIINRMSTEALMETVLTNPYFADIWAFDSIETGIEVVSSYVDGLAELIVREDFADVVNLISTDVSPLGISDSIDDEIMVLKKELMQNVYEVTRATENGIQPLYSSSTVKTPKNSSVSVWVGLTYTDHGITQTAAKTKQTTLLKNYPSATIVRNISSATAAYNCHSYAWYSTSTSNNYWMDNPSVYMTDGSYSSTTAKAGTKVYWRTSSGSPVHSGIVYSAASNGKVAVVTSKWGAYGLIRHNVDDSPYSASSISAWK